MNGQDRQIDVVQQLIVVFHGLTGRKEDHQFLLPVLLKECKEEEESLFGRTDNVSLGEVQVDRHRRIKRTFSASSTNII